VRLSLILATIGRTDELKRFLASLRTQTYRDFELIVVDQNVDDRLAPILAPYEAKFSVLHLRSEKGLSRARNVGLRHASGDIIAFPDDDCWYPPELLGRVVRFFLGNPKRDGLTGRSIDEDLKRSGARFDATPGTIDRLNVWKRGISYTMFLRSSSVKGVLFREQLGVGAGTSWGSSEESDYLLQLIGRGASLFYDPRLVVFHPKHVPPYTFEVVGRAYEYGCGVGRVLRIHRYPLWFVIYQWARPLGGTVLALGRGQKGRASYHWAVFRGRFSGWLPKVGKHPIKILG
jgi:glycosyltransferase involved in cell wall biosynthesis